MKATITSNKIRGSLASPDHLEGSLTSEDFRAQFHYEYPSWSNLPEPAARGNITSYLKAPRVVLHKMSNPLEVEFCIYYVSPPVMGYEPWEIQNNNANFFKLGVHTATRTFYITTKVANNTYSKNHLNFFNVDTSWYKIKLVWSGTQFDVYRNDVLFDSDNAWTDLALMGGVDAQIWLYRPVAGGLPIYTGHKMAGWKYWLNSVLVAQYPICEESGNIAYDVSGNGNHAIGYTGYNALTWDRDQDCSYWLGDKGYRLSGAVYIPSLVSQTAAADGNPLTNIPPNTEFN